MLRVHTLIQLFALSGLIACKAPIQFEFPLTEAVRVTRVSGDGSPKQWSFEPSTPQWIQLQQWTAKNQGGWSPYPATEPGFGLLVEAGRLRLHFIESSALLCPDGEGCFSKSILRSEYEFLQQK
jgi:hypothetical protein